MKWIVEIIGFLRLLIPLGVGARVVYCYVVMHMNDEEERSYKARIRNGLVFVALAEGITELLLLIANYF